MKAVRKSLRGKASDTTEKGYEKAAGILETAREILAVEGIGALSMRAIALKLGITLGNVQHYFKTKDDLIEALLLHTLDNYQADLDTLLDQAPKANPAAKFKSAMQFFVRDARVSQTRGLLFELGAMSGRDKRAARALSTMLDRATTTIERLLRDLLPGETTEGQHRRAKLIIGQLIGFMFYVSAQRGSADIAEVEASTLTAMQLLATKP